MARAARKAQASPGKRSSTSRRSRAETAARKQVVTAGLTLEANGLTPGKSGNVSVRFGDGMLISPSGMPYSDITVDDVVLVSSDGDVPDGQRKPSSEWRFHLSALQARPDRHAVVHTHSRHATILACRHEPIPAFHYMVAVAGGADIPCVPYAAFGTDKLAAHVAAGLEARDACLMANHGMIALGDTMAAALDVARDVEELATQYCSVLALGGPKVLNRKQMADVLERFKSYGQANAKA
ncbi:MAG: class II aldolase/adducin family protein [Pseudomonadota bacterium]